MTVQLALIAAGDPDAFRPILQNCRFEGFGVEAYGREAIQAMFGARPATLRDVREVSSPTAAAVIGKDEADAPVALFADLCNGWITRLWRLGDGAAEERAVPTTDVPVDFDLDQRGGRLAFHPGDHPALDAADATRIAALGDSWLNNAPPDIVGPLSRTRPVVLRALSGVGAAAALFRIQGATVLGLGGFYAAAMLDRHDVRAVADAAGRDAAARTPWRPNLR